MKKNNEITYDAIIVGAGPGGSALSAILANAGMKILLIDKHAHAGGKMMTIEKDGFSYEMFPLNGVPTRNSHFEKLMEELDVEGPKTIFPEHIGHYFFEMPNGKVRTLDMRPKVSPFAIKKLLDLNLIGFMKFLKIMANIVSMKEDYIESIKSITFNDYIEKIKMPKRIASYLIVSYCEGYFQTPPDRISAAAVIRAIQQTAKDGGGRYYEGGIGKVFEAFASKAEKLGAQTLYNTRVEKILVKDEKVNGVIADGIEYHAKIVISNAGIQSTVFNLVDLEQFDSDYIEFIRNIEGNLANVGFRWILDAPILDSPMNIFCAADTINNLKEFRDMERGIFPEKAYLYLGTTSLYPGCAPKGKQLVYACMSCLPDPRINIEPYLEVVRKLVKTVAPDVLKHIEHEETFGPKTVSQMGREPAFPGVGGEDFGAALTPEQYGDKRLNGSSPISGLFFVGCDVAGFGLGTHQALDSAINVSKLVLEFRDQ